MSSHNLVLVAIAAENPAWQREDVHGSRFFSAFVAISRYSALTWILNLTEIWSCLKCTFKTTILQSQAQSFLYSTVIQFTWLINKCSQIHSFPAWGSFVAGKWCSNSFESWDEWSCTSWEKEGPGSVPFKISAMFETRQKSQCSLVATIIPGKGNGNPLLPEKSHGQRSLAGYNPKGHKESNMSEQLNTY